MDEALRFHRQRATHRVHRKHLVRLQRDPAPHASPRRGRAHHRGPDTCWARSQPAHPLLAGRRGQSDPGSAAYGVLADGQIVPVAFSHRSGILEHKVADLGVETSPAHRRRGYAQTVVSPVVASITHQGGEARYGCAIDNSASAATARSVGFVPYATVPVLASPQPPR